MDLFGLYSMIIIENQNAVVRTSRHFIDERSYDMLSRRRIRCV